MPLRKAYPGSRLLALYYDYWWSVVSGIDIRYSCKHNRQISAALYHHSRASRILASGLRGGPVLARGLSHVANTTAAQATIREHVDLWPTMSTCVAPLHHSSSPRLSLSSLTANASIISLAPLARRIAATSERVAASILVQHLYEASVAGDLYCGGGGLDSS